MRGKLKSKKKSRKMVTMEDAAAKLNKNGEEEIANAKVEEEEDDEHDCKERVLQKYFLQEWNVVKSILDDIVSAGRVSDLSSAYKIRTIVFSLSLLSINLA